MDYPGGWRSSNKGRGGEKEERERERGEERELPEKLARDGEYVVETEKGRKDREGDRDRR